MTVFGTTIEPTQLVALIGLLLALAVWIMALKGETSYARWFRQWEADRKARRDAELAAEAGDPPPSDTPRGPWG